MTQDFAVAAKREPRGRSARWHQKYLNLIASTAALVLVAAIAGIFVLQRVREDAALMAANPPDEPAASVKREPMPLEVARPDLENEIADAVRAWAMAWSRQDTEAYLDFYSARFVVPSGMSRYDWESLLRLRLESIVDGGISIGEIEVSASGPENAVARFVTTLRTTDSGDWVAKTLELVKESGRWRIQAERSVPVQPPSQS